jgi:hypothetical protein
MKIFCEAIPFTVPTDVEFTLGYVMQLHLENHVDIIHKITDVAINEYTLESALDKMHADLRSYTFEIVPYRQFILSPYLLFILIFYAEIAGLL